MTGRGARDLEALRPGARHRNPRTVALVAAAALLAAVVVAIPERHRPQPSPLAHSTAMRQSVGTSSNDAQVSAPPPADDLPASLQGTQVPGDISADANGDLVINRGLRDFFDYFLSASSEESAATIRSRVIAAAKARLEPRARQQLLDVYDDYVAYKAAAAEAVAAVSGNGLARATARLAALRRVRAQTLRPDVVRAFFGDDDVYDDYEMTKAEILTDRTSSATEKAEKLAQLRAGLPAALSNGIAVAETVQTLQAVTSDWRQRGGSAAELRSIRQDLVGAEATERLEALDAQNAQWSARVAGYMDRRAVILSDASLSEDERQRAVADLRAQNFSDTESIRIGALERIHDSSDAATSHAAATSSN